MNIHCVKCGQVIAKEKEIYIESNKFTCVTCNISFYIDGYSEREI